MIIIHFLFERTAAFGPLRIVDQNIHGIGLEIPCYFGFVGFKIGKIHRKELVLLSLRAVHFLNELLHSPFATRHQGHTRATGSQLFCYGRTNPFAASANKGLFSLE